MTQSDRVLDAVAPHDETVEEIAVHDHEGPTSSATRTEISALLATNPASIEAEAIRGLRTRVMAQHVREGRRSLAICTPHVESGCTFVASNLALAVAQIGVKTVLVDADLRTPGVAEIFGIAPEGIGLADYLADPSLRPEEIVNPDVAPNLSVLTAGARPSNPQELLSGDRFRTIVDQLMREFELTIFDTTPANSCTDAQRVATVAGYSLIVARKNKSFVADVATLSKLLRADKSIVVGTVLNDF
jgi:protein-tyrosine kinase